MRRAISAFVLLALLAPASPFLVSAEEELSAIEPPPTEEASISEETIEEQAPLDTEPQNEPSQEEPLEVPALETAPPEHEVEELETLATASESPAPVFSGIGQTARNAVSDHMASGEWYLGQTDITFTLPGKVHYIAVFPDISDPDFIDCKDTVYAGDTLSVWLGRGTTPIDAMEYRFTPMHREPREDGSCVYENKDGMFVYPGPRYQFLLNNGYGPTAAFDYLGSRNAAPAELGVARISNKNVSAAQLVWKRASETVASLAYLIPIGNEPPPPFGVPLPSDYVFAGPGITLEELSHHAVLAQGTSEVTPAYTYPLSYAALNEAPYFIQAGNVGYVHARLGYFHYAPDARVYFKLENKDCRTPEKLLFEWGILSASRNKDASEVILGPFSGADCSLSPIDTARPMQTAISIRTMMNGARSDLGSAAKGTVIAATIYSKESLDPCAGRVCASNVLFLPGIKGSRLYVDEGGERRLWEPNGDDDVPELFLKENGVSARSDVYVKPGQVVDDIAFNLMNIYDEFIEEMDGLVEDGTIRSWEAAPYDWRLSLADVITKGAEREGRVFFSEATSTPYIEQTLRRLAKESDTGKVTIVAHSNGGLVTKALLKKLGNAETARLVDKIVFVAVPQSGAPQALGALLYGQREQLPAQSWLPPFILSQETARAFAENSPMGYHLLPSQAYFDAIHEDYDHPVARFVSGYPKETAAYDGVIGTFDELARYLRAEDGGRAKPDISNLHVANVLNSNLIEYAKQTHEELDAWVPPEGVRLYQIAGWGEDTIAGVEFYEECGRSGCKNQYRPIFTEDGDGVVPVPSALLISANRYWIDLQKTGLFGIARKTHGNLFEIRDLLTFLQDLILGTHTTHDLIKDSQPPANRETKKLQFFLHSPLTLKLLNADGSEMGQDKAEIEGATYGEFGEVKYIIAPAGNKYTLLMNGTDAGTFSLDIQEVLGNEVISTATIADVPVTKQTIASLTIETGVADASPLSVDVDGDAVIDFEIIAEENKTVTYEESASSSSDSTNSTKSRKRGVTSLETDANVSAATTTTNEIMARGEVLGYYSDNQPSLLESKVNVEAAATTAPQTATVPSIQPGVIEMLYNFLKWFLSFIGINL